MVSVLFALFLGSYFLGSIPFGVLVSSSQGVDILKFGSGNPGATNVGRALGTKWAVFVFILDTLKGALPAVVARYFVQETAFGFPAQLWWMLIGIMAILGHCLSPFLKFKGGKGVATSLGAAIGASPIVAFSAFGCWILIFLVTRYVSLASMIALVVAAILSATVPGQAREIVPIFIFLAALIIYRHIPNIKRLRDGTEPKYESGKRAKAREEAERKELEGGGGNQ